MKAAELRKEGPKALREKVRTLEASLVALRMQRVMGQVNQTHKFAQLRRTIAKIRGLLTEFGNKAGE